MTNEEKAMQIGNNKKLLTNRFKWSLSVMSDAIRHRFPKTWDSKRLDMKGKRYIGYAGYYLQWKLRDNPDQPESYNNQQTSKGRVEINYDNQIQ